MYVVFILLFNSHSFIHHQYSLYPGHSIEDHWVWDGNAKCTMQTHIYKGQFNAANPFWGGEKKAENTEMGVLQCCFKSCGILFNVFEVW